MQKTTYLYFRNYAQDTQRRIRKESVGEDLLSDDNKVVPFPAHRVKRPKVVSDGASGANKKPWSRNRVILGSLFATVVMATLLANKLSQNDTSRMLASDSSSSRSLEDDILLAKKISIDSLRKPSSVSVPGKAPTPEDVARHGDLNLGSYRLKFEGKALVLIEYVGDAGQDGQVAQDGQVQREPVSHPPKPKIVKDRVEFILNLKNLLSTSVDDAKLIRKPTLTETHKTEVYAIIHRDTKVGRVRFKLDGEDRLILMKVEVL